MRSYRRWITPLFGCDGAVGATAKRAHPRRIGLMVLLAAGIALLANLGPAQAQAQSPVEPAMSGLKATAVSRHAVRLTWMVSDYASVEVVTIRRAELNGLGNETAEWQTLRSSDDFPYNVQGVMNYSDSDLKPGTTYRYTVQLFPTSGQAIRLDWSGRQCVVKTVEPESGGVAALRPIGEAIRKLFPALRGFIVNGAYPEAVRALGEWYTLHGSDLWEALKSALPQTADEIEKAFADLEKAFQARFGTAPPVPVSGKLVAYASAYRFPPGEGTSTKVNSNISGKVMFYNKGDGPVTITGIDYPNPPFFAQTRPDLLGVRVAPSAWVEIVITFRSPTVGEFRDKLTVHTNNGSVSSDLIGITGR